MNNITAHVVVKNEEKWIWYALASVYNYVDEYIVFDTGSTDNTVSIIEEFISSNDIEGKVIFFKKGEVTKEEFYLLRQEQISMTKTEWFLVLDGDEIWYEKCLDELIGKVKKNNNVTLLATRFHNAVGDVYHYKDFTSESYEIKGVKGSVTIRAYKIANGIHCKGEYGVEGYYDDKGQRIQLRNEEIEFLGGYFFHTSYLQRSSSILSDWVIPYRRKKVFARFHGKVDQNFRFPEVFYLDKPEMVDSPWRRVNYKYYFFRFLHILYMIFGKFR